MPDAIHFEFDRLGDVVTNQLKAGMSNPLPDIAFATGEIVVKTDHVLARFHQPVAEV